MPYLSVFNQEKKVIRGVNTKALKSKDIETVYFVHQALPRWFFFSGIDTTIVDHGEQVICLSLGTVRVLWPLLIQKL